MNELILLKKINAFAISGEDLAKKLMLEWLSSDLTDFGSKDMIFCKMQSYLEDKENVLCKKDDEREIRSN